MKWLLKKRIIIPAILVAIYFLGPSPNYEAFDSELPTLSFDISGAAQFIADREAKVANLKENNEARILWADSSRQKTEYAIVYLHGFSASQFEGDPIHKDFAKRYGANLYLPRISGHGIDSEDSFEDLTPKKMIDSAKEALAIGKLLGEKVILMSCSTGGTYSAYLAAERPEDIHSMVMYSPNIDIFDSKSRVLTKPWGLQIARLLPGGKYQEIGVPEDMYQYWTHKYRKEGLVALRSLLDQTMLPEYFEKITCPVFVGYYYKNEQEQDHTVSVGAMKMFSNKISTPKKKKKAVAFPDAGGHVFICGARGANLDEVKAESYDFAESVLGLKPVLELEPVY